MPENPTGLVIVALHPCAARGVYEISPAHRCGVAKARAASDISGCRVVIEDRDIVEYFNTPGDRR